MAGLLRRLAPLFSSFSAPRTLPALSRGFAAEGGEGAKLYVGNLPWGTTEEDLKQAFSKYGVIEAYLVMDRVTGRSRGMGFITVEQASMSKAIEEMNGQDFGGRR